MKRFNLSAIGMGLLTLSLAVMPLSLPASAQTNTQTSPNNTENKGPVLDTTPFQETRGDRNNWGWLGLIGLVGLINLFRKGDEPAHHTEHNEINSTVTTDRTIPARTTLENDSSINSGEAVRYKDPNDIK